MEQARLIIAIALSVLIFLVWDHFFMPKTPPPPTGAVARTEAQGGDAKAPSPAEAPVKPPEMTQAPATAAQTAPAAAGATTPVAEAPARLFTVLTPLYEAELTTRGAAVTRVVLTKYKETSAKDSPDMELVLLPAGEGTLATAFSNGAAGSLATDNWNADSASDVVDARTASKSVTFTYDSPTGVLLEKTYTFTPDSYLVGVSVKAENGSGVPVPDRLYLGLKGHLGKPSKVVFQGPLVLVDGRVEQVQEKKIQKDPSVKGTIGWAGLTSRYFLSAIAPAQGSPGEVLLSQGGDGLLECRYVFPGDPIPPAGTRTWSAEVFFGPKSTSALAAAGHGLDRALDFGWFDILAKPLLWLMNFMHSYIPNYGLAIIFLTILVKLAFWPLSTKSYKSMASMKKIAPLMQELREKYKHDKPKMNEEIFALYRTFKVNPMSGCLPMVVQIPVFIALYKMLYESIELRHSPFVGWITDLSVPDRLFHFGFSIPFMEPPFGIPVLTIIMGASMFIQQKMTPAPGDPAQAKMMMLLPIVFTFIFINFPSGLVLYWLVNNIISMAQQYYIQRKYA